MTDTFVKDNIERQIFILTNSRCYTSSLIVQVTSGTVVEKYLQATDITKIDSTSKGFFLEESEYQIPEILFGDGVVGTKPIDGNIVTLSYVVTNGIDANGATEFT